MSSVREVLRSTFGFDHFRGVQEQVVGRVLDGRHTLAVMPTGAGKSLCYQLPALVRDGTALVISPLIALMHDQIRSADAIGLRAASLTSADSDRDTTIPSATAKSVCHESVSSGAPKGPTATRLGTTDPHATKRR